MVPHPSRTAPSPRRARGPGRPPRGASPDAVRARLLRVAQELFAERGYAAVSVRALARAAHVSPAMIAYYFRDKAGLLDAVVDEVFERLLAQVRTLAEAPAEGGAAERFIRLYLDTLAREPWLPSFLVREVLGGEPAQRARFAARFPARLAPLIVPLLRREAASGRLRPDLDPALTLLSVLGMCAFPFLVQPLVGPILGYQLDDAFASRLADHTVRLFLEGARGVTP
jgi:AcrR family transcriptional regulator